MLHNFYMSTEVRFTLGECLEEKWACRACEKSEFFFINVQIKMLPVIITHNCNLSAGEAEECRPP